MGLAVQDMPNYFGMCPLSVLVEVALAHLLLSFLGAAKSTLSRICNPYD